MRIAKSIFVGSLAALVAGPALAKNSDGQKTEDKQASVSCQAYQKAPDGSWTPLPCRRKGTAEGHRARTTNAVRRICQPAWPDYANF